MGAVLTNGSAAADESFSRESAPSLAQQSESINEALRQLSSLDGNEQNIRLITVPHVALSETTEPVVRELLQLIELQIDEIRRVCREHADEVLLVDDERRGLQQRIAGLTSRRESIRNSPSQLGVRARRLVYLKDKVGKIIHKTDQKRNRTLYPQGKIEKDRRLELRIDAAYLQQRICHLQMRQRALLDELDFIVQPALETIDQQFGLLDQQLRELHPSELNVSQLFQALNELVCRVNELLKSENAQHHPSFNGLSSSRSVGINGNDRGRKQPRNPPHSSQRILASPYGSPAFLTGRNSGQFIRHVVRIGALVASLVAFAFNNEAHSPESGRPVASHSQPEESSHDLDGAKQRFVQKIAVDHPVRLYLTHLLEKGAKSQKASDGTYWAVKLYQDSAQQISQLQQVIDFLARQSGQAWSMESWWELRAELYALAEVAREAQRFELVASVEQLQLQAEIIRQLQSNEIDKEQLVNAIQQRAAHLRGVIASGQLTPKHIAGVECFGNLSHAELERYGIFVIEDERLMPQLQPSAKSGRLAVVCENSCLYIFRSVDHPDTPYTFRSPQFGSLNPVVIDFTPKGE